MKTKGLKVPGSTHKEITLTFAPSESSGVQFGPISTCSEACLMASAAYHLLPNPDCVIKDTHLRSDLCCYRTTFDWAFTFYYTKAELAS
ncbi:hypothetical protein TNCV_3154571 [Trichonephila clavipes]|nr:hypothetical protein TNCV_3154571 [Trichonephila clavipes]